MATKKKAQVADEVPVTAPLFVKHHYLILESEDGVEFYVDRNAALTSRLVATALKELGNRADEEAGGDDDEDGGGNDSAPSARRRGNATCSYFICGGDVEVKCNGEKAATTCAQLPIVYPSTLMAVSLAQQRPGTGDGSSATGGRVSAAAGGGSSRGLGAKAAQQLQAQQELLAQQLMQYQQVDAALHALSDLPLTHLRLVHIPSTMLETAIRFMQYKYKNDLIPDAEARQAFFGFVSSCSYPPSLVNQQQQQGPFSAFGSPATPSNQGSPSKQRRSVAAGLAAAAAAAANGSLVDPITGGPVAQMPPVGSQRHMELVAVSLLLQL